jgi:SAM-dependent methyltransferase
MIGIIGSVTHDPASSPDVVSAMAANRANWDERTALHLEAYGVDEFLAGESTLKALELGEVGDVAGRSLLHLQCHFGLDTMSWARLGATVTGVDFSEAAIAAARRLSDQTGIEARFIQSNVYALPQVLDEQFDIVFTSYGVLNWLPDIEGWARVAAGFVRDGGLLYVADGHPFVYCMNDEGTAPEPGTRYFHDTEPFSWTEHGSYVGEPRHFDNPTSYEWQHSLGDIVSALIDAGIEIEFLHEWPFTVYRAFMSMERGEDGYWRLPGNGWPLLYSLRGRRRPR